MPKQQNMLEVTIPQDNKTVSEAPSPLAPVVLFVYKRPQQTKATLEALVGNHLASSTDLVVFSDAARSEADTAAVEEVRSLFHDLEGFRSVRLVCRETNQGLANRVARWRIAFGAFVV